MFSRDVFSSCLCLMICSYDKFIARILASSQQSMLFTSHQAVTCPYRGEYPYYNEPSLPCFPVSRSFIS